MKTEIFNFVLFLRFYSLQAINTTNSGKIGYFVVIYDAVDSSFQRNLVTVTGYLLSNLH